MNLEMKWKTTVKKAHIEEIVPSNFYIDSKVDF